MKKSLRPGNKNPAEAEEKTSAGCVVFGARGGS